MRSIGIGLVAGIALNCALNGHAQPSAPAESRRQAELQALAKGVRSKVPAAPVEKRPESKQEKPATRPVGQKVGERLQAPDRSAKSSESRIIPPRTAPPKPLPVVVEDANSPIPDELDNEVEIELDAELEADLLEDDHSVRTTHEERDVEDRPEALHHDISESETDNTDIELSESELAELTDLPLDSPREASADDEEATRAADDDDTESPRTSKIASSDWKPATAKRGELATAPPRRESRPDLQSEAESESPRQLPSDQNEIVLHLAAPEAQQGRRKPDRKASVRSKSARSPTANPLRKAKKKSPGSLSDTGANPLR